MPKAFPFALILIVLSSCLQCFSQFQERDSIVHLSYSKTKGLLNGPLVYGKYRVIDNRIDSTSFISTVISNKRTPLKLRFEDSPSAAIENYISELTGGMPHGDKELVISLRRYIQLGHQSFFFTADAYERQGDASYIKICTIDTAFQKHATDYLQGKALLLLLDKVNSSAGAAREGSGRRWTLQEIEADKVYTHWGGYAIFHDTDDNTGIYMNLRRMYQDDMVKMDVQLRKDGDSAYQVSLPDKPDSLKQRSAAWSWYNMVGGLKYQGAVYIRCFGAVLPARVRNSTMYIHMPEGYPTIFSYILWWNANEMRGRQGVVGSLMTGVVTDPILKHGKESKECRDAYLDSEKGILVYY